MGICWSFFEEIFFWIVVEFRQGVSGSEQSNWWSGGSWGVKGQRYCFFLMRVNASWLVSAEHSLKWCFCGFWFNLDEEYQAPNEASDDHEEPEVSRDKGIFCWMRVNASLWVSAKHSLKWCFCGFLFNLEEEYQAQNKERDKGKVLLSESKSILISICCKVFKRMFLCCKFFRRLFLCSFM